MYLTHVDFFSVLGAGVNSLRGRPAGTPPVRPKRRKLGLPHCEGGKGVNKYVINLWGGEMNVPHWSGHMHTSDRCKVPKGPKIKIKTYSKNNKIHLLKY